MKISDKKTSTTVDPAFSPAFKDIVRVYRRTPMILVAMLLAIAWVGGPLWLDLSFRTPIPFLLLSIVALVGAAVGGVVPALINGLLLSAFILYSAGIGFGPASLTGSVFNAVSGSLIVTLGALYIGYARSLNILLLALQKENESDLEQRVARRTKDLDKQNKLLKKQIRIRREAEQKAEYHASLLEEVSDAIIASDREFRIKSWNKAATDIYGWQPEEVMGKPIQDILKPDYGEVPRQQVVEEFRKNGIWQGEIAQQHRDGRKIWVMASVVKIVNKKGDWAGAIGVNRDITSWREAQFALRESEARYRHIVETAYEGICRTDADGNISFLNSRFAEMLGYDLAALSNKPFAALIVDESDADIFSKATPASQNPYRQEVRLRHQTGELITVQSAWTRIDTAGKKPAGAIALVSDITELTRIQQALRESESLHRMIADTSADIVSRYDQHGILIYASEAFEVFLGTKPEDLLGKRAREYLHPDDVEPMLKQAFSSIKLGKQNLIEARYRHKDGRYLYFETTFRPIFDELTGDLKEIIAAGRLIQDRKEAETALLESEARHRSITELASEGILLIENGNEIAFANQAVCDMLGFPMQDLKRLAPEQLFDPGMPENQNFKLNGISRGETYRGEICLRNRSGEHVWAMMAARAIVSASDSGPQVLLILSDVTEQHQTRKAFEEKAWLDNLIADTSADYIARHKPDGTFVYCSASTEQRTGYKAEEMLGRKATDFIHPEDVPDVIKKTARAFKTRKAVTLEFRMVHKTGKHYWVETQLIPSPLDPQKRVEEFVAASRVIDQRRKAEIALKASENKYRGIVNAAGEGIWQIGADARTIFVNGRMCDILGTSQEALIGKHISDFVHSDDKENSAFNLDELRAGKTIRTERRLLKKDGSSVFVNLSVVPQLAEDGSFAGATGIIADLTEMHRMMKNLEDSESRHRFMYEHSKDLITTFDVAKRKIETASPSFRRALGLEETVLDEIDISQKLHADDTQVIDETIDAMASGKSLHISEQRLIVANGSYRWFQSIHQPKLNAEGKLEKIISATRDIHDLKEKDAQLRRSRRELRALTQHLQHVREQERKNIARELHDELGQNLTVYKMELSMLQDSLITSLSNKDARELKQNITTMKQMIDHNMAHLSNLITELRSEILDNLGLIAAIEWQIQKYKNRSDLKCLFQTNRESLPIENERAIALFRIFQEALTNVARHARADLVTVDLIASDDTVTLSVSDNGIGFEYADQVDVRPSFGLLGMRERAILLGGVLEIHSRPGEGTEINVSIPLTINGHEDSFSKHETRQTARTGQT